MIEFLTGEPLFNGSVTSNENVIAYYATLLVVISAVIVNKLLATPDFYALI